MSNTKVSIVATMYAAFVAELPEVLAGNVAYKDFRANVRGVGKQAGAARTSSLFNACKHRAVKEGLLSATTQIGRPAEKNNGGRKPLPKDPNAPVKAKRPRSVYTYNVKRAKDGTLVAEGLSKADAEEMVAKAEASKKAKLVIEKIAPAATVVSAAEPAPAEQATEVAQEAVIA